MPNLSQTRSHGRAQSTDDQSQTTTTCIFRLSVADEQ